MNNRVEFAAMRGSRCAMDVRWELHNETPDVISLMGISSLVTVRPIKKGVGRFHMTAIDNCGRGTTAYVDVHISSKYHVSLFPNPAADVVTLKLTEPEDGILSPQGQGSLTTKGVTSTYEIQLWNGLTMLRSFKTNQSADLPNPDLGTSDRAVFRACDQRRTDLYRKVDQELASEACRVKVAYKRTVIRQTEGMIVS